MGARLRATLLTLLAGLAVLACWAGDGGELSALDADGRLAPAGPCSVLRLETPARPRNVLFVLSDTLRRDRLGAYGGPARTPAFDGFAESHRLFTDVVSQAPWTKPSIATLFTGLYPSQHQVVSHPDLRARHRVSGADRVLDTDVLAGRLETLAEALATAGYDTAAFVGNPWLQRKFGFAQGFDVWEDGFADVVVPGRTVTEAALRWLEGRTSKAPYFLYLHYMDAHSPYPRLRDEDLSRRREQLRADRRPLGPLARSAIPRLALHESGDSLLSRGVLPSLALMELVYDKGVEDFDLALGELLRVFGGRPDAEETAIVITSDHGEALFTRDWVSHGYGLYEDELAVPMAASLPGVRGPSRVDCLIGLVDVRATLCTYLGVECAREADFGVSFVQGGEAEPKPAPGRFLVSEGVIGKPGHRAIRNQTYKLLHLANDPGPSRRHLHDLDRDPGEERDLLDAGTDRIAKVAERLERQLESAVPPFDSGPAERVPMDRETQRRLEALGYLEEPGGDR